MQLDKGEVKILKEAGDQKTSTILFYFILSGSGFAFAYLNRNTSEFAPIVLFASGLLLGMGIEKLMTRRIRLAANKVYRLFFEEADEND